MLSPQEYQTQISSSNDEKQYYPYLDISESLITGYQELCNKKNFSSPPEEYKHYIDIHYKIDLHGNWLVMLENAIRSEKYENSKETLRLIDMLKDSILHFRKVMEGCKEVAYKEVENINMQNIKKKFKHLESIDSNIDDITCIYENPEIDLVDGKLIRQVMNLLDNFEVKDCENLYKSHTFCMQRLHTANYKIDKIKSGNIHLGSSDEEFIKLKKSLLSLVEICNNIRNNSQ